MRQKDLRYLALIVKHCSDIASTIARFGDFADFLADTDFQKSCTLSLQQIGEYANKLSDEFKSEFDDIPWRKITGVRNIIAHDYESVDFKMIWTTLTQRVPALRKYCEHAIIALENRA